MKGLFILTLCLLTLYFSKLGNCVEEKDYYKILGVARNANDKQIKRAYKKLSIKWHPDKNKDNQDYAKEMFVDVSNAYDTLSDPGKRKAYNQGGIKGVQDYEQQQGQQNVRRDMFGRVIHTPDPDDVREDFFKGTDVFQINLDTIHSFYRRNQVWVILFYKSNQQESKDIKQQYIDFVNRMYGIFGTAAIDCIEDEEICDDFVVFDTPTIMVFTEDMNDEGHKFSGKFEANRISKFATDKMQSFISIVNKDNYDNFIAREPENYKALLFSNKKSPSAMIKSLSKTYNNKILFGYVRDTETELMAKFGVTKVPTLLVVTDPVSSQVDIFEGENKLDIYKDFFRTYAYYKREQLSKQQEISELTTKTFNVGPCGPSSKTMCMIFIKESDSQIQPIIDTMNTVMELYSADPISFHYVDINNAVFEDIDTSEIKAFILRPSAKKYSVYEKVNFSEDNIRSFIDNIISGNGRFKRLSGPLTLTSPGNSDL